MRTHLLSGARLVLPDRVVDGGSLIVDGDRIAEIRAGAVDSADGAAVHDLAGRTVVPGFIDVHVHGVEGCDTLASDDGVGEMARRLPRYGVTAFCPTTIACTPSDLRRVLQCIRASRMESRPGNARVLPAHLESNFINPEYRGGQPLDCIRALHPVDARRDADDFAPQEVLDEISSARSEVGIVTLAPELPGGLDLARALADNGHLVSLGHSGASYEEGLAGVDAGARHATHLFNRMTPFAHRAPGLVGAIFDRREVSAEIVCDGHHVHPSVLRAAVAVLGADRTMAITDGTAASGLPRGTRTELGRFAITALDTARYDDGTMAGSTLTMDRVFRNLIALLWMDLVAAARVCSTTPARQLGLARQGKLEPGALADFVVLDDSLQVVETWIGGVAAYGQKTGR
jgi:N-acetylglucosamine-6-phosphate deacetylase